MAGFRAIDDRGRVSLDAEQDEPTGCAVAYFYNVRSHYHEATLRWPNGATETINRDQYHTLREAVNDILVAKAGFGAWHLAVVIRLGSLAQERVYLRRSPHGDWDTVAFVAGSPPPSRDHYVGDRRWPYTEFDGETLPARCLDHGHKAVALPWDPLLGKTLADYAAAGHAAHQRMVDLLDFAVDRGRIAIKGDHPGVVQQGIISQIAAETAILGAGSVGSRAYDLTVALSDLLVAMHDRGRWGDGIPDELIPLVGDVAERAGLPVVWWDDAETASRRFVLDGVWIERQYDRWRRTKFASLVPARTPEPPGFRAKMLRRIATHPQTASFPDHDTSPTAPPHNLPTIEDFINDGTAYRDVSLPLADAMRPKITEEGN